MIKLDVLTQDFSVCKIHSPGEIDWSAPFCFVGQTDEELSLVCETERVPSHTLSREDGWRGFRICGVLDFSLIGILSKLSSILAEEKIGIYAVSTYNTDYIFTKSEQFPQAIQALERAGYAIQGEDDRNGIK